ncbi:hypothetical protein OR61_22910 [Xanthomonas vesicatoria]|uniref:Uncharacterized protein n=1 Tax=Xanthomonas vesicatoria TaxID=56460 RepID=A0AAJ0N239_9XANT|nr:hypothetical protein OR61_22910 [Xanthomonas vesicatoria]
MPVVDASLPPTSSASMSCRSAALRAMSDAVLAAAWSGASSAARRPTGSCGATRSIVVFSCGSASSAAVLPYPPVGGGVCGCAVRGASTADAPGAATSGAGGAGTGCNTGAAGNSATGIGTTCSAGAAAGTTGG